MAIGDDAISVSPPYQLVPDTGETGRVRWGAQEINRTRDYVAQVKKMIDSVWPISKGGTGATSKSGVRANLGMTSGPVVPANTFGQDGDWFMKVVG